MRYMAAASKKKVLLEYLHLFVLTGFAMAQPVYDLLGRNPEFFVAHKANPMAIIGLVLFLSVGAPFCLCLMEMFVIPFGDKVRRSLHLFFIGSLAVLILLPLVKRFFFLGDTGVLAVVLIGGTGFSIMYLLVNSVRMFLTVLSPAILVFPLWFIFMTPVARLVLPESIDVLRGIKIKNPVPVVLIVLDEFNTTALLDDTGQIDSDRFPSFGELSDQSFWFPNAVASHIQTMHAIPAILTGMQPRTDKRLTSTATDYPENLFTFLGSHYQIWAQETQTSICPENICIRESEGKPSGNLSTFFSDIAVIYLHIVTPPHLELELPKLGVKWTGYATREQKHDGQENVVRNRGEQFETFISKADKNKARQLLFLHILLPHLPYRYLATGHTYNKSINHAFPEGIQDESSGWSQNESLIQVAYLQYLQQIGYVDHLLGNLFDNLRQNGLFDKSLIILTADHGISFQPGQNRRYITPETASDILKVPLFVKLPGQNRGEIEENLVLGIDILPTIADVLGMELPWEVDGRSVFQDTEPPRSSIEIPGFGRFGIEELTGFPGLEWQLRYFGWGTHLSQLGCQGPFPELVGRKLSDFVVKHEKEMQFNSDIITHFDHLDPDSGFLPALFSGYVSGTEKHDLPLAISLNGRIRSTTTTSQWLGMDRYFVTLFPSGAFKQGRNRVDVLMIDKTDKGIRLLRIPSIYQKMNIFSIRLDASGEKIMVFDDGVEIPVDMSRKLIHGYIDHLECSGNTLHILGWAGDSRNHPVDSVLIFEEDQLVVKTRPYLVRQDVARYFNQESMLLSGFQASIPIGSTCDDISGIKVFAVSSDGIAGELGLSEISR